MAFDWSCKPIAKSEIDKPSGQALKVLAGMTRILKGIFHNVLGKLPVGIGVNHFLISRAYQLEFDFDAIQEKVQNAHQYDRNPWRNNVSKNRGLKIVDEGSDPQYSSAFRSSFALWRQNQLTIYNLKPPDYKHVGATL